MFFKKKSETLNIQTLTILAIVALITFFAVLAGNIADSKRSYSKIHQNGEVVKYDNAYSITVDKVMVDSDLAKKMHIPDDKKILVIHAIIKNTSNQKMDLVPALQTYLRDNQGGFYTLLADVSQPFLPSKVLDIGEEAKGNIAFVVESREIPLWFYFDSQFKNQAPTVYNIVR